MSRFNQNEPIYIRLKPLSREQPHGQLRFGALNRVYLEGAWTEEPPSDGRDQLVAYLADFLPHSGMYADFQTPCFEILSMDDYDRHTTNQRLSEERQRYQRIMGVSSTGTPAQSRALPPNPATLSPKANAALATDGAKQSPTPYAPTPQPSEKMGSPDPLDIFEE